MSGPFKKQLGNSLCVHGRENAAREKRERNQHLENIAAINAIADQLAADEKEQDSNDQKRRIREWLTIILVFATVVAAIIGDVIFYRTMKDGRTATEENMRAWAGPNGAKIDGTVVLNQPVSIQLSVVNTGREPAKNFVPSIFPGIWDTTKETNDALKAEIDGFVQKCMATTSRPGAQALFPSVGLGTGFTFTTTFAKEKIDQDVISGRKVLVTVGCLVYDTAQRTRHSTFCYSFKNGFTKPENLNLCFNGNTAD